MEEVMDTLNPVNDIGVKPMKIMSPLEFQGRELPQTAPDVQCSRNGKLKLVPDEEVYPDLFDTAKMSQCYVTFMKGGSFKDCHEVSGVDMRTIAKWSQMGDWLKMRGEVERAADEEEAQRLAFMRRDLRLDELKKQIKAGQILRERVTEKLEDDTHEFKPSDLKMLGEALKAAGDNTVRALGVNEIGSTTFEDAKTAAGKAPLVVLIQGGGLPTVRPPQNGTEKVIDV